MNTHPDTPLVASALAALETLGLRATAELVTGTRGFHSVVKMQIRRERTSLRYQGQILRNLTPAAIGSLTLALPEKRGDRLLVTDYVTPPIADDLRQRRIQFIDTAGNAYLDRRGLFVFVSGRRRPRATNAPPRTLRVFRPSGLKIIFALLSEPELASAPLRTIAHAAKVALGGVALVMDGLRDLGFIAEHRGIRRVVSRERLLQQWTEAYARQLEPSLELGRFSAPSPDWWRRADLTPHAAQWGGETAAALLQKELVPEWAIIYADELPARLLSVYRLKADPNGRVVLRRRFWNAIPSPRPDIVPPLLVYADLVAAGDARSLRAATQIRDAYLV